MNILRQLMFILLLAPLGSMARNAWFDKPIAIEAGWHMIDSLSDHASELTIHARLVVDRRRDSSWGIAWNWTDSLNYTMATITTLSNAYSDEIYGRKALVEAYAMRQGSRQDILTKEIIIADGPFSLKLVYDGVSARLHAGNDMQTLIGTVPLSFPTARAMLWTQQPAKCQRLTAMESAIENIEACRLSDLDELRAYLSASKDSIEGMWEHLDRDIHEDYSTLGGRYRLATIANDTGAYDIVYIDGAKTNSQQWRPMQIKGTMNPTIFVNNFDLSWRDAFGVIVSEDCYAMLSDDHAVLTLCFPLYRAQIRFRRVTAP